MGGANAVTLLRYLGGFLVWIAYGCLIIGAAMGFVLLVAISALAGFRWKVWRAAR